MVLSDHTIQQEILNERITIDPLGDGCIQPASVDLRLDKQILEFHPERYSYIDVREPLDDLTEPVEIPDPAPYILKPNQFVLASTIERIQLADDIVARLEGKSSLGRLGLLIHSTAGYIDPGWNGQITLEISNVAGAEITLYYGMKISQISFLRLSTPAISPYGSHDLGSKYQGQVGPTASRINLNSENTANNPKAYRDHPTQLREWLGSSVYQGNLSNLAKDIGVPVKTLEEWVYGRHEPNNANRAKLYEITGIIDYKPTSTAQNTINQTSFFGPDGTPKP